MRGIQIAILGAAAACSWAAQAQTVFLDDTRLQAVQRGGSTVLLVPLTNQAPSPVEAELRVAWVMPDEKEASSATRMLVIAPGAATVEVPFPLAHSSSWTRLRYSLKPAAPSAARFLKPVAGVASLPHIAAFPFEVRASITGEPHPDRPLSVFAQPLHPVARQPVDGVVWNAVLSGSGDEEWKPRSTRKHAGGVVEFVFDLSKLPADADPDDFDVDIEATLGDFTQNVSLDVPWRSAPSARMQTDKPLYQPGQSLRVRAVLLDARRRAWAGAKVALWVESQAGDRVHSAELTSSRYGVVHDEWTWPESTELGLYRLTLQTEVDGDDIQLATHTVRLNRYELPLFKATVQPDRGFYLPGQSARVTVRAEYLFGKPVPKARVKIAFTNGDGKPVAEGEAGSDGIFTAPLDLTAAHQDLGEHTRFDDEHYTAYVTDSVSGRTEERKFDVRLSREPLHVYVSQPGAKGPLPAPLYVTVSHAEGRPAQARVKLQVGPRTYDVSTNRYGVGRTMIEPHDEGIEIRAEAVDATAPERKGTWMEKERSSRTEGPGRLTTARTLHRAGESVTLSLAMPGERAPRTMLVHAVAGGVRVATRAMQLAQGRGEITFPYQPEFRRAVTFVAWTADAPREELNATRTVLFPDGSDLAITATPERATYRPGETAALRFRVAAADGRAETAALGLAIVDEAVFERARDGGERPWFACAYCGNEGEVEVGGVRLNDLFHLPAGRIATDADLDLVAEFLATQINTASWNEVSESMLDAPQFLRVKEQMRALETALDRHYASTLTFPRRDEDLLAAGSIAWANNKDPWDNSYRAAYKVQSENYQLEIWSAGPDRQHRTADDFLAASLSKPYFAPTAQLIREALEAAEDYPASEAQLAALLASRGLALGAMPDPWGSPYRASVHCYTAECSFTVISNGADRLPNTDDDAHLATFRGPHFRRAGNAIRKVLAAAPVQPQTEAAFHEILTAAGVDLARDLDPWQRPYRLTTTMAMSYADVLRMRTERVFGQPPPARGRVETIPVTQRQLVFKLRSDGPDGRENTYDDFDVAQFFVLLSQESAAGTVATTPAAAPTAQIRGTGAIAGKVVDATGAVVPGVRVILRDAAGRAFETTAAEAGVFEFRGVPRGEYSLEAESPGFRKYSLKGVPVQAASVTTVEIQLEVGAVVEAVEVNAAVPLLMTSSAQVSVVHSGPVSTPRVRDYFPETLLWQPEIVTAADGTARVTVPLAGNITTWKVAAIASTLDGRFAETETSFRAFQPFFADFTPPSVLTAGDRIDLPVTVRNYAQNALPVSVQFAAQSKAVRVEGPDTQSGTLTAGESRNYAFRLHADSATNNVALQALARAGNGAADALRRDVRIQPDGQRVVTTRADLITRAGASVLDGLNVPDAAIAGATRTELRIYPNTAALLWESASAVVREPHGCAEQITTAGYANLIALRFAKAAGSVETKWEKPALTHVRQAVEALSRLAEGSRGGVPYWRTDKPDVAVTAYALGFLLEAREAVPVDAELMASMVAWLEREQRQDGAWEGRNPRQLTAHVARALAQAQRAGVAVKGPALASAFHLLGGDAEALGEPYLLAQYALAAMDAGQDSTARAVVDRLAALAQQDKDGLYWDLRTNTPFHGWGHAGRQESTGLAVQALSAWRKSHNESAATLDLLIRRGTLFLLRERNAGNWWGSTQGTLRAMQALVAIPGVGEPAARAMAAAASVTVRAGGQTPRTIALKAKDTDAIIVDLGGAVAGPVELTTTSAGPVVAQLVTTHWLPWPRTQPRASGELRLAVNFSSTTATVGEPVHCRVRAERVGFRGYGMMIAEVGLPPGAEVDRASLPYSAEVLPDRVRFYVWPKAGGEEWSFYFTARYPLEARSAAPSILYDYYNPEALTEVPPVRWRVD